MPRVPFSWAALLCAVCLSVNCRTLGHENHGAQWFWLPPLHLTNKTKDMWPLVHFTFKNVIVSNMPILKYIIFHLENIVHKLSTGGILPQDFFPLRQWEMEYPSIWDMEIEGIRKELTAILNYVSNSRPTWVT